jgi:hypothetical protein
MKSAMMSTGRVAVWAFAVLLACCPATVALSQPGAAAPTAARSRAASAAVAPSLARPLRACAAASVSLLLLAGPPQPALAESTAPAALATKSSAEFQAVDGFEDFAAQGGKMKADPSCFFNECKEQTTSCFTNPVRANGRRTARRNSARHATDAPLPHAPLSALLLLAWQACLKGITCLGNCRGEQLCATQCFARFGSERLNAWLGCTLEDKECVTTGVKQDTTKYYANPPPAMSAFTPADLEGKWYKVLGYNPKYDTYPCQTNTFTRAKDGGLVNDILFRVPKPDGSGSWQNNFIETMDDSKGPEDKASMTVEGKMFGLTFHEQWYVLGKGDGFRVVSYIGDTQQGPYEGAFVFTSTEDALRGAGGAKLRTQIDAVLCARAPMRTHARTPPPWPRSQHWSALLCARWHARTHERLPRAHAGARLAWTL